jgi:hypothetical protein
LGYENNDLTQLSFGTISNLESIDLTGLTKLTGMMDLRQFDALKEFYASGSGITGVNFAPNAPLEEAVLPQVSTLILRGLRKLKTLSVDSGKLLNLRLEDCPGLDSLSMVRQAVGLQRGRLTGVNWQNADTDTLMRLSDLGGYDEEGRATETFVLTGTARISTVAQEELDILHERFPNLEILCSQIVPSFTVSFQNEDGTLLHTQKVRRGGTARDPVSAGWISVPEKEASEGETYHFAGWDFPLTDIQSDRVLTAVYVSAVRKYTVRWFDGSRLLQTDTVEAYAPVSYRGSELTPTEEDVIWIGWDKSDSELERICRDLDVYAAYLSPRLPEARATNYDYLYSDDPSDKSGYSLQDFYGIIVMGKAEEYFTIGDKIKLCTNSEVFADREIVLCFADVLHNRLVSGEGFAQTIFSMVGLMNAEKRMNETNTNVGGWHESGMRAFLNQRVFPSLPQRWKAMIKKVQVLATEGGASGSVLCSEDRLFLLSAVEVGSYSQLPYTMEVDVEARHMTLPVYTDLDSRVKKHFNGAGTGNQWLCRSPYATNSTQFIGMKSDGGATVLHGMNNYGVSFAFCI